MNELSIKKMANQTWIGGIILVGLTYGGFATISNYILPYSERTGASIAQISVSFTIIAIATTIFSLFMGNIIKRMKAKTIITISAVMLSLIHFALAFSNSLIVLYIAAFLFGTAVAFTGFGFMQTVIMWWFEPNKIASKISFLTIGLAVFSFIESPVIAQSIISNGLKMTAAIHGVVDLVGVVVVGIVLIKENPKHYGFNLAHNESANTAGDEAAKIKVVPLSAVLKTYPFWCLFLVTVFLNLTFMGYSNNASPFYQSFGLDPLQAAFCISIVSVCQVGTAPLFGYLVDKLKLTKPTVFLL